MSGDRGGVPAAIIKISEMEEQIGGRKLSA